MFTDTTMFNGVSGNEILESADQIKENRNIREQYRLMNRFLNKHHIDMLISGYKKIISSGRYTGDLYAIPDVSDMVQLIDYWVTIFESTIWNYTKPPFRFSHNNKDFRIQNEPMKFYSMMQDKLTKVFSDKQLNFKTSFSSLIRDWFEFGTGVLLVSKVDEPKQSLYLETISPENISFFRNPKNNQLEYAIIYYQLQNNTMIYKSFEKIGGKWDIKTYNAKYQEDELISHTTVYFTPIYITHFNPTSGYPIGYGRGLEALPILAKMSNLMRDLNVAAEANLKSVILVTPGSIDFQKLKTDNEKTSGIIYKESLDTYFMDAGSTMISQSPNSLQHLPRITDANLALRLVEFYREKIKELLSPNRLIDAKGTSGMSEQETMLRNSYDKSEITHMTASIIDDILKPLIREIFKFKLKDVIEEDSFKNLDPKMDKFDFEIDLNNTMGSAQIQSRLSDINVYLQMLNNIQQMSQQPLLSNPMSLVAEISSLLNISTQDESSSMLLALSNSLSQLAQNNIEEGNQT